MNMLQELQNALELLPDLLNKREAWDSLVVNRRKPHTYRVFTHLPNGFRVCLHKFTTCHQHEAFPHPHPWAGAFLLLQGKYKMTVGHSPDRFSPPDKVMEMILTPGCMYEIIEPHTWHAVIPLETTYTIMVNGEPWDVATAHHEG